MLTTAQVDQGIQTFAKSINQQVAGLAIHRPEDWAKPTMCFDNVIRKVSLSGGKGVSGWMFQFRVPSDMSHTGYLIAIHHAVWANVKGYLFDITPFHGDPQHHPITVRDGVIFLPDLTAPPVYIGNFVSPLPSRFFPLTDDPCLLKHVTGLREKEETKCSEMYAEFRNDPRFRSDP